MKIAGLMGFFGSAPGSSAGFKILMSCVGLAICFLGLTKDSDNWKANKRTPPELLKPIPGEISVEKAIDSCHRFLKACGMAIPKGAPMVGRDRFGLVRGGLYNIDFGVDYRFSVDCKTSLVTIFTFSQREYDRRAGKVARVPPLLRTQLDAKLFVAKLARRLKVPLEKRLGKFEANLAGDKNEIESNGAATVKAEYQEMPDGFRLREGWGRVSMTVDPSDGAVIYFGHYPDRPYTLESKTTKLTADQARTKAAQTAARYKVGRSKSGAPTTPKMERMYVYPNGEMGGYRAPRSSNPHARLAWVARYSNGEEIWIDAGDGRLLGGEWSRSPNKH